MKARITLLFFFLTISFAYAQYDWTKGELILKSNDTLKGEIKLHKSVYSWSEEKVMYRKNWEADKVKYDEYQVKKVIFKNADRDIAYYKYVQISSSKKSLLKVISSGKVNLYARYVGEGGLESYGGNYWKYDYDDYNEFYVLRKNKKTATLIIGFGLTSSFKKRTMDYFSDCPGLVSDIKNRLYLKSEIKDVVDDYNDCL